MATLAAFEKMLAAGRDSAALRFGLGNAYLQQQDVARAVEHLGQAVKLDPEYSAAWKIYGRALAETGRIPEAIAAYEQGIRAAMRRGDKQAEKEMRVFLRRLRNPQIPRTGSTKEQP